MSYKGQYLRGEKWYLMNRDADGNLKDFIKKQKDKMVDVNLYLEAKKKKEELKVKETKSKVKK